jgi:tRNA/rRNA methyltransferase
MSVSPANLVVVLHQTRSPDNLGAVARLMANFGFYRLALSEPVTYAFSAAQKLAVGAEESLDHLELFQHLPDALDQAVYACGTTGRREVSGREVLSPEEGIRRLSKIASGGRVALVFGGEKRGLSDQELSLCDDLIAIPTQAIQPSMNLSQAVAVLLYLCSRVEAEPRVESADPPGATLETARRLEELMQEVLLRAGFLNPQAPQHLLDEMRRSLWRSAPTQREAELWLSAFNQLRWALRKD